MTVIACTTIWAKSAGHTVTLRNQLASKAAKAMNRCCHALIRRQLDFGPTALMERRPDTSVHEGSDAHHVWERPIAARAESVKNPWGSDSDEPRNSSRKTAAARDIGFGRCVIISSLSSRSPFITAHRTGARRCAPRRDHRICCCLPMRLFRIRLSADSAIAVEIGPPSRCRPL
jgi:hypothetical protein